MAFPLRFVGKLDAKLQFYPPRTSVLLKKSKGQLHEFSRSPRTRFSQEITRLCRSRLMHPICRCEANCQRILRERSTATVQIPNTRRDGRNLQGSGRVDGRRDRPMPCGSSWRAMERSWTSNSEASMT